MKMSKQSTESDLDLNSLELFSQSLESRNRALQKILLKLQKDSGTHSCIQDEATKIKTKIVSDSRNP